MKKIILLLCTLLLLGGCTSNNTNVILKDKEKKIIIQSIVQNEDFHHHNDFLSYKIGDKSLILSSDNLYISLNYSKGFDFKQKIKDKLIIDGKIHTLIYSYEFTEKGLTDKLIHSVLRQNNQPDLFLSYDPTLDIILNTKTNTPALLDESYQLGLLPYFQNQYIEYNSLFNSTAYANSLASSIIHDEIVLYEYKKFPIIDETSEFFRFLPSSVYSHITLRVNDDEPTKILNLDKEMQLVAFASFIDSPITSFDDIPFETYFSYINQLYPGEYTCYKPENSSDPYYSQLESLLIKSKNTSCYFTNTGELFPLTSIDIPNNQYYTFYSSDYLNQLFTERFSSNIHFQIDKNRLLSYYVSQSLDLDAYITLLHYASDYKMTLNGIYIESIKINGTLHTYTVLPYFVRENYASAGNDNYILNNLGNFFLIYKKSSLPEVINSLKNQFDSLEIIIDTAGDKPKIVSIKSL